MDPEALQTVRCLLNNTICSECLLESMCYCVWTVTLFDYFHFSGGFQAARNCLVNSSLVVKVSDFGMTRYLDVNFIIHVYQCVMLSVSTEHHKLNDHKIWPSHDHRTDPGHD